MSSVNSPLTKNNGFAQRTHKLMAHAFVCPDNGCVLSAEVKRGMSILSKEGTEVGQVAAVILDSRTRKATHILLSRLPETIGYWMVPVSLIAEVQDEFARLDAPGNVVDTLPTWQSE